jgi:hypothetical protein
MAIYLKTMYLVLPPQINQVESEQLNLEKQKSWQLGEAFFMVQTVLI